MKVKVIREYLDNEKGKVMKVGEIFDAPDARVKTLMARGVVEKVTEKAKEPK